MPGDFLCHTAGGLRVHTEEDQGAVGHLRVEKEREQRAEGDQEDLAAAVAVQRVMASLKIATGKKDFRSLYGQIVFYFDYNGVTMLGL